MSKNNLAKINDNYFQKKQKYIFENTKEHKIYTPEIIFKYKNNFKKILKLTNNKTKTNFIMYSKILKWYENEKNIDIRMEKVYIKSKLGSYNSGGCGLTASFLAGLTSSSIIYYVDNYLEKNYFSIFFNMFFYDFMFWNKNTFSRR